MSNHHDAYGRPAQGAQPAMQSQRKCGSRCSLRRCSFGSPRDRRPGLQVQLGRCIRRQADTRASTRPDRKSTIIDNWHDVGRGPPLVARRGIFGSDRLVRTSSGAGLGLCEALGIDSGGRWAPGRGLAAPNRATVPPYMHVYARAPSILGAAAGSRTARSMRRLKSHPQTDVTTVSGAAIRRRSSYALDCRAALC